MLVTSLEVTGWLVGIDVIDLLGSERTTTMDPHRPDALVGATLLALSALAILVSFRGLFPHRSDDDCAAIVHSIADVQQPPRPSCAGDGGAAGAPPFPTLATLSLVPLLVFMMVRYVSLRLYLRN
jgi:hypothetical protein